MTPRTLQLCRFEQGGPEVLAWTPVHATVIGMGSQEAGFARRSPRFRSVTCLVSFSWSLIEWFGDWGLRLNPDVHTRRHAEGAEGVHCLCGRLRDVDESLVSPYLELLT